MDKRINKQIHKSEKYMARLRKNDLLRRYQIS